MVQIREATAKLRLVLAEIHGREEQLDTMIGQFTNQLSRLPRQAIYGRASLDMALSSMGEIQERLDHARTTRAHLLAIKQRTADELSALHLTQQVEEAKEALRCLKTKQAAGQTGDAGPANDEGVETEVRRLEGFIAEYSKVAERTITASLRQDDPPARLG